MSDTPRGEAEATASAAIEWREPPDAVDEAKYRLGAFQSPAFDHTIVRQLIARIDLLNSMAATRSKMINQLLQDVEELATTFRNIRAEVANLDENLPHEKLTGIRQRLLTLIDEQT